VRHNLVQQIIRAYEEFDMSHPPRGGNGKPQIPPKEPDKAEQSNS